MCPTSGTGLPELAGDDAERVQVRGLALVGRHAGRRVALDVLDRAEAFARREREVVRRHVVLEIDEGLAGPCRSPAVGGGARCIRRPVAAARPRTASRGAGVPARRAPRQPGGRAVRERVPRGRTRRGTRRRECSRSADVRRNESARARRPGEPAARLREEVHARASQPPDISTRSQAIVCARRRSSIAG